SLRPLSRSELIVASLKPPKLTRLSQAAGGALLQCHQKNKVSPPVPLKLRHPYISKSRAMALLMYWVCSTWYSDTVMPAVSSMLLTRLSVSTPEGSVVPPRLNDRSLPVSAL